MLWSTFISLMPGEWAQFTFMHYALLAVLVVTPLFAFMGCMVINNQMAFYSDAIGHSALTGIAIGALLGMNNPLWSMLVFALLLSFAITFLRRFSAASSDTIIGIVMSFTIALGIVILSRGGGFNRYSRFLIGDLLSITPSDIAALCAVTILFILLWIFFFNRIFLVSMNSSLARSRRIQVWYIQGLFAAVIAIIVTMSIQWIGILVINALLILPASASRNMAQSMAGYLWMAAIIAVVSGVAGLIASFYLSTATGATIVLFAMFFYILSLPLGRLRRP
jgi:zinc transport system permease protein